MTSRKKYITKFTAKSYHELLDQKTHTSSSSHMFLVLEGSVEKEPNDIVIDIKKENFLHNKITLLVEDVEKIKAFDDNEYIAEHIIHVPSTSQDKLIIRPIKTPPELLAVIE